jgi:hypothetical protein
VSRGRDLSRLRPALVKGRVAMQQWTVVQELTT